VLFGSIHMLPRNLEWQPPALTQAMQHATDIWFEIPIDRASDETAVRLGARAGQAAPGDPLWSHLTESERADVERAAARLGLDPARMANLRPWMADLTLELAADARAGGVAAQGVEARLQREAPPSVKRHALETARQQIGFLAGSDVRDQAASLVLTARQMLAEEDSFDRTLRDWLSGDQQGLDRDDLAPMEAAAPKLFDRLITARNHRWADVVARLARRRGATVIVVGAGHMVGPHGLPALLRARGLAVDGPR
jgi:uncharacterized protein YbaP (TraB family)